MRTEQPCDANMTGEIAGTGDGKVGGRRIRRREADDVGDRRADRVRNCRAEVGKRREEIC